MQGIFSQGSFTTDPNATPEQLKRKRDLFTKLMSGRSPKTAGEGMAKFATGIVAGLSNHRSNKTEKANQTAANDIFGRLMNKGGTQQTPSFNILDSTPPFNPTETADPNSPQGVGNDVMSALNLPQNSPQDNTRARVKAGLVQRGLPEHVADGFTQNFQEESGLDSGINEVSPLVAGSRGGFGLAQWTGPRRVALEKFAAEQGVSVSDENMQMDFLMQELQGSESNAANSILATKDASGAASAIATDFLRPSAKNLQNRLAKFGGQSNSSQPDMTELYKAASNPWLSQEQRQIVNTMITQQQTAQAQANDPLRQLQIAQAEKDLGAPAKVDTYADANGYRRNSVTNERVNPTLVKTQDPTTAQRDYDFYKTQESTAGRKPLSFNQWDLQSRKAGAGNTSVTTNLPNQSEFDKVTGKKLAETTSAIVVAGDTAQRSLIAINRLQTALNNSPQGAVGSLASMAGSLGFKTEGSSELEVAEALISQLVPAQRPPGSGTMSDADLALFKKSLPSIINTPDGNRKIIETIRAIAEYDMKRGDIAAQVQFGEIKHSEARKKYRALTNPLANLSKEAGDNPESVDTTGGASDNDDAAFLKSLGLE